MFTSKVRIRKSLLHEKLRSYGWLVWFKVMGVTLDQRCKVNDNILPASKYEQIESYWILNS